MDLAGRTAIVTGGASGIGAACVARLSAEGARVVSWDLSGADVECDVADLVAVERALAETLAIASRAPTLLVAAAGVSGPKALFTEISVADFERTLAVNTTGVFLTMQAIARAMIDAGLGGSMVAIASVNGVIADPTLAAYSASKAAVFHLARVAAVDLGPFGIRVNAIGPGPTSTPMIAPLLALPGYVDSVAAATPLRTIGTPELVADGVVNVMRADWITGQAIMVDGGSSLATARGGWRRDHQDADA